MVWSAARLLAGGHIGAAASATPCLEEWKQAVARSGLDSGYGATFASQHGDTYESINHCKFSMKYMLKKLKCHKQPPITDSPAEVWHKLFDPEFSWKPSRPGLGFVGQFSPPGCFTDTAKNKFINKQPYAHPAVRLAAEQDNCRLNHICLRCDGLEFRRLH